MLLLSSKAPKKVSGFRQDSSDVDYTPNRVFLRKTDISLFKTSYIIPDIGRQMDVGLSNNPDTLRQKLYN